MYVAPKEFELNVAKKGKRLRLHSKGLSIKNVTSILFYSKTFRVMSHFGDPSHSLGDDVIYE